MSASTHASKPRILLVDDEPALLDGLRRMLRFRYDVTTAPDGATALQLLADQEPFAAVVSDMRMPEMDGAALLSRVREVAPDTVRMLLTGQADLDAAVIAINDGQVFRFLTKPCPPEALQRSLDDAVRLYELTRAERDLLDKTLRGAVQALTDALALAQPQAFARAQRITRNVEDIADEMNVDQRWEVDLAAMLCQLGSVSLPAGVLDKLDRGMPLTDEERGMVRRVPQLSAQLLIGMPRLERVAAAIARQGPPLSIASPEDHGSEPDAVTMMSRILKVAIDFDYLTCGRMPAMTALAQMRTRPTVYHADVIDALSAAHTQGDESDAPVEVGADELRPGMVLAVDVPSDRGVLLVGRGTIVSEALIRRLRNHYDSGGTTARLLVLDGRR